MVFSFRMLEDNVGFRSVKFSICINYFNPATRTYNPQTDADVTEVDGTRKLYCRAVLWNSHGTENQA